MGQVDVRADPWQRATAVASILSVLAVGAGLIVTNNYNREQQQLALQGQITERFTKAVEQLGQAGPEKIDVRLGAIHALERLMRDSVGDQPAVVDILSAFVRVHSPSRRADDGSFTGDSTPRPVDIQASLTVLVRRNPDYDGSAFFGISLSETDLSRARLGHASLSDADLIDADLRGAILSVADLSHADLVRADLRGANLSGANLRGADLSDTKLDPEQIWCAHIDEDTVLPAEAMRLVSKEPDNLVCDVLG